jgi:hypothetical protein
MKESMSRRRFLTKTGLVVRDASLLGIGIATIPFSLYATGQFINYTINRDNFWLGNPIEKDEHGKPVVRRGIIISMVTDIDVAAHEKPDQASRVIEKLYGNQEYDMIEVIGKLYRSGDVTHHGRVGAKIGLFGREIEVGRWIAVRQENKSLVYVKPQYVKLFDKSESGEE